MPIRIGVDSDPLLVQGAIAIPVTTALVIYTLLRRDRTPLHLLIGVTLASVVVWLSALMVGWVAAPDGAVRALALEIELFSVAIMPPIFVVAMGRFARSPLFEQGHTVAVSLGVVSLLLWAAGFAEVTRPWFITDLDAALRGEHPREWGGPLYWGQQFWCFLLSFSAVGFVVGAVLKGRTAAERKRALTVLGAIATPFIAHQVYLFELLPIDYSLATGAMAPCALFFVQGVNRYGVFVAQPIVRQDVIDHFHDGVILADQDGTALDANRAAEAILGLPRRGACGRPLAEILAVFDGVGGESLGERVAALPLRGEPFHEQITAGDGRVFEITAGVVAAAGSQPGGRFISLRDRSEQRRSERMLQDRQRLESVGILAAGVAHEVNNPLAFVRANLGHMQGLVEAAGKELRIEPGGPGEDLLELPDVLCESLEGLDRIRRIVDGLLQFSRASEDAQASVELNRLVDDALRLAALHRNRDVAVERRLAAELPTVPGSPQRLVQVVLNLLLNARQSLADRPGGRIVVETAREGDCVEIRISDNGPGVAEKDRAQIFDLFFTTRPPGEGTGLGLSIASDIVHEHGGTLELRASCIGGACFAVRLPFSQEATGIPSTG